MTFVRIFIRSHKNLVCLNIYKYDLDMKEEEEIETFFRAVIHLRPSQRSQSVAAARTVRLHQHNIIKCKMRKTIDTFTYWIIYKIHILIRNSILVCIL